MFATTDTIVAVATPPGPGGIGIVRLSGPDAQRVAGQLITHTRPLEPRHATLTRVVGAQIADGDRARAGSAIDHVVVTYFPAPASYTGDDVVEISAHGSPVVLTEIVRTAAAHGARLAERGEFTLRAFLNGRIDLPQAEAVADLIEAATPLQAHAAFDQLNGTLTRSIAAIEAVLFDLIARLEASVDFPDEGYHFVDPHELGDALQALIAQTRELLAGARRGRLLREGVQIAIVGAPNVGKSSVFNALVGTSRAIVADQPGTTRDLVSETIDLDGLRATLVDTAGLRSTDDVVELEGVRRAEHAARAGDLVLLVVDRSRPWSSGAEVRDVGSRPVVMVANKSDLQPAWTREDTIEVSATTGAGIDRLRQRMMATLNGELLLERPRITNIRHIALVERAEAAFTRAREAVVSAGQAISEEFVLADLQAARDALGEVVGHRAPEDVLAHIFARFCVGK